MTAPGTGGPAEDAQMRRALQYLVDVYAHQSRDEMSLGQANGWERAEAALSAAAGSVPEDGGEALRREVERLREALEWLVRLKDGPRDDAYYAAKPHAWERARAALSAAAAAVRERREDDALRRDAIARVRALCDSWAASGCDSGDYDHSYGCASCMSVDIETALDGLPTAPVGGRSQDEQERP